jgi:hypothetical protein
MEFSEILWGLAFCVAQIFIAWGMFMLSVHLNIKVALILFAIAPLPLVGMDIFYVVTTADFLAKRMVVSTIIGAISVIFFVEQARVAGGKND